MTPPLRPAKPPLFRVGDEVRHRKGGVYRIIMTPECLLIEATGEPAYAYALDGLVWVRSQREMGDGRFRVVKPREVGAA